MQIKAALVDATLERHAVQLKRALHHGGDLYGLDDIRRMVMNGNAMMFPTGKSVAITRQTTCPAGEVLDYWLLAGDLDDLLDLETRLTAWADENGAVAVKGSGRAGWGRVLEARGYSELGRSYIKRLR